MHGFARPFNSRKFTHFFAFSSQDVPESARMVLMQEDKFKSYYAKLQHMLREHHRIMGKVIPITAKLLEPHIANIDSRLRPGLVSLTWTSMNIDGYQHAVHTGLRRLEELCVQVIFLSCPYIAANAKLLMLFLVSLPRR